MGLPNGSWNADCGGAPSAEGELLVEVLRDLVRRVVGDVVDRPAWPDSSLRRALHGGLVVVVIDRVELPDPSLTRALHGGLAGAEVVNRAASMAAWLVRRRRGARRRRGDERGLGFGSRCSL